MKVRLQEGDKIREFQLDLELNPGSRGAKLLDLIEGVTLALGPLVEQLQELSQLAEPLGFDGATKLIEGMIPNELGSGPAQDDLVE